MTRFKNPTILWIACLMMLLSLHAAGQTAQVWLTQGGGSARLTQQGSLTFGANSGSSTTVTINEGSTFQSVDGYGFTLTQGSAKVISQMGATQQNSLLNELFGANGLGMSLVRIGIGATDLSDYSYSYRDGASFSLAGPDLTHTIPILKKILAINPGIKVLATPWSAPMWMKTSGSFIGGTLKAENYESYGQYWLDYMNAMKAQGITIWAVTPQNEPLHGGNEPSMTLTKENELGLINSYIAPKLRGAGFNCKIITYDHNCDNTEYPIYVANNSSHVDGAAFHLYAGNISALSTFRNATGKNVYFTEQYTGAGGSFSGDLVWHTQNVTIGSALNWSRTAMGWNLATDPTWGPHTPGGCTDCKGAVTVSGNNVTRNQGYYIIGHFSKFVKSNAVRIGASSNHGNLITTAFRNTDGSKVVQVLNNSGGTITFRVVWNNTSFTYALTASSVVTFRWSGSGNPGTAPIGSVITLRGNNNMFVSGENGTQAMRCDRATAGTWEQFAVVDAGGGKIGLRSMNKYVSSENGAASGITCNRTTLGGSGSWEHFDWVVQPDGKISLRGNNGQFVTSNNGVGAMTCNRPTAGAWEAFTYAVVGTSSASIPEAAVEYVLSDKAEYGLYPNPVKGENVNVRFGGDPDENIKVNITDSDGRVVWERSVKNVDEIAVDKSLKPGIYYVRIFRGREKTVKRLVVE